MVSHSSLFSQVLTLVNRHQFQRRVKECKAEKGAKGFSCWTQFVSMMFAQLAQAKSLREIIDGLACCEAKLNHLGLSQGPKRSTLCFANAKRVPLRAVCGSFFTIIATEVLAESMGGMLLV